MSRAALNRLLVTPCEQRPAGVPAPGTIFAGKYLVERLLRAGGMGAVVAATHIRLDERVAIKVLLPSIASDEELVARFLREGRAQVKIKSEHVARVLDVASLEDGSPYIVMDYLEGRDLERVLEEDGVLPIGAAIQYVLQACEALAEAHALGIVHRDLKPANLFLTRRADGSECIKLLDFGIAKVTTPGELAMTKTRAVLGSPLYMAPEQLRSCRTVDGRADIWALGAVLHELVTGGAPFEGSSAEELAVVVSTEPPIPLRTVRKDAPPELEALVLRCLEKEPAKRFATIAEFAQAASRIECSLPARASAHRIALVMAGAGRDATGKASSGAPPPAWAVAPTFGGTSASLRPLQVAVPWRAPWLAVGGVAVAAVLAASVILTGARRTDANTAPAALALPPAPPVPPTIPEAASQTPPLPSNPAGEAPPTPTEGSEPPSATSAPPIRAPAPRWAPARSAEPLRPAKGAAPRGSTTMKPTAMHVEDIH